jgi:hypothetical protein
LASTRYGHSKSNFGLHFCNVVDIEINCRSAVHQNRGDGGGSDDNVGCSDRVSLVVMAEKISERLLLSTMTARLAEEEAGRCVEGSRNKLDRGKKCRFGSITTSLSGAGVGVKGEGCGVGCYQGGVR